MTLATVISKFEGVKETGPGKYIAICSAHEDRSPSLGIRETDGGHVLLICRAGCPTEHVLAAVGLSFMDLFPESPRKHKPAGLSRAQQSEIDHALIVCEIAKTERARGVEHSASDQQTILRSIKLLQGAPAKQRVLSVHGAVVVVDDFTLLRTVDRLRDYKPWSLCDSCGKPFDQSAVMPDSWYCLSCEENAHG